jgi:putative hemolysin
MRRWGTHLALVRNETGILTGLLTMEDLIEEIVGDIRDEHDEPAEAGAAGERAMGGPRLVNGEIPIIDFNDHYNASLPLDVSYSTLNGYLLSKTGGEIPPIGSLIFAEDVTFRVHSVSESGIATVEIIDHARGTTSEA